MEKWQLKTPVCLIIFKRPDTTEKVFEVVRKVKPPLLLVIADGPRPDRPGEAEKCAATRKIIDGVDWDCEVLTNYSDVNLGLKQRVASGLNWVFETVEEAIVLEDDCLPDQTFFRFCEELLDYYRQDDRVMVITGTNFLFGWKPTVDSYYFSRYIDCWGWATWRRAWQHFDFEMKGWPERRDNNWLGEMLKEPRVAEQWTRTFQATYDGYINSWAFRWKFACWMQNGLTVIPAKNLVANIGFNAESTNTKNVDSLLANTPVEKIEFPLKHPEKVSRDAAVDEFTQKIVFESDLSYLRDKMGQVWLNLTTEELESRYQQERIRRILNTDIRSRPLKNRSKNVVKELTTYMSTELDRPQAIQYLLAAMLYTYPHKLPLQYNLSEIPQWLLDNYLKFAFEPPSLFQDIGEYDSYYQYLQRWVNYLHANIVSYPNAKLWQQAALSFTQNSDFSPLYQTTADLKSLYVKRTEIIELILRMQGYQLDYDFTARMPERNKIRLGILADNMGLQPETWTTLPIYKFLHRDRFEIVFYSLQTRGDRLERYCSGHVDAGVQLPEDLASQVKTIRDDDLDILFIASNITAEINLITLLASHRLARIQVAGMNSPVTTGMRHVDYYIAGKLTEPENNPQQHYAETLITLEGAGQCIDFGSEEQVLPTSSISKESLGIPEDAVLYVAGANLPQITPEVEELWAKVIKRVPNSRLILYPFNYRSPSPYTLMALKQRLAATLARHDLEETRSILITSILNRGDRKELLQLADIYLDSYPTSSLASVVEPLEVAVPMVVMELTTQRSRVSASLLRELQIPELITSDSESYLHLAVALGNDIELRQGHREQIEGKMRENPSFLDSRAYSAKMESIFQELFQKQQGVALKESLRLREINLIIFPDWSQSEELLLPEIATAIAYLAAHGEKAAITLLIDTSNISDEDADAAISSVAMHLLMEEDLDVSDGPEISLIGKLSKIQWSVLLPQLHSRIRLENENQEAISRVKATNLPCCELDNLSQIGSASRSTSAKASAERRAGSKN